MAEPTGLPVLYNTETATPLAVSVQDEYGNPVSVLDATAVVARFKPKSGATFTGTGAFAPANSSAPQTFFYQPSSADLQNPGTYQVQFTLTVPAGKKVLQPAPLVVEAAL